MNPPDPDNAALDALFLRSTKHPEVRVELCRALPRGPVDGADEGELVEAEAGGD